MAREGIGTIRMKLAATNYTPYSVSGGSITLRYTPNPAMDYSVAWDNYLTKTLGMTPTGTPGTYQMTGVTTLVIKTYEIKIESI